MLKTPYNDFMLKTFLIRTRLQNTRVFRSIQNTLDLRNCARITKYLTLCEVLEWLNLWILLNTVSHVLQHLDQNDMLIQWVTISYAPTLLQQSFKISYLVQIQNPTFGPLSRSDCRGRIAMTQRDWFLLSPSKVMDKLGFLAISNPRK